MRSSIQSLLVANELTGCLVTRHRDSQSEVTLGSSRLKPNLLFQSRPGKSDDVRALRGVPAHDAGPSYSYWQFVIGH